MNGYSKPRRRQTPFVYSVERKHRDRPQEDVVFADAENRVFAVADGVTRDRLPDGSYPVPSPARRAAEAFRKSVPRLASSISPKEIFTNANIAIRGLNRELGLSKNGNYLEKDVAGVVAAVARERQPSGLDWAFLGDAGVALIGSNGALLRETDDQVAAARQYFPEKAQTDQAERRAVIRGELRNDPHRRRGGYGVLTGEDGALAYVRAGSWPTSSAEVALVFTDGFRPLLQDARVRDALTAAVRSGGADRRFAELCRELRRTNPETYGDEASMVAWEVGPTGRKG